MKNSNEKELNPEDFKDKTPVTERGVMFNNLHSQAYWVQEKIKNTETEIVETVNKLMLFAGTDNAKYVIDSICHYVENEFEAARDCDNVFDEDTKRDISREIYCRAELAKSLIDLSESHERLKSWQQNAELTKRGILL